MHGINRVCWSAGSSGNNNNSAVGTALGVAAPCIGVIIWLAVTYAYRQEKRALTAAVVSRLTPYDVGDKDTLRTKQPPVQSRQMDREDSATNFIIPVHREPELSPAMVKVAKEMTHRYSAF